MNNQQANVVTDDSTKSETPQCCNTATKCHPITNFIRILILIQLNWMNSNNFDWRAECRATRRCFGQHALPAARTHTKKKQVTNVDTELTLMIPFWTNQNANEHSNDPMKLFQIFLSFLFSKFNSTKIFKIIKKFWIILKF